jgi:hypothetical protein
VSSERSKATIRLCSLRYLASGACAPRSGKFGFWKAGAAVFFDEGECRVNRARIGRAKDGSPLPLLFDKTGGYETAKVESKRRGGDAETRLQFSYRQALFTRLYEQADDLESGRVPKLSEAARGNLDVHAAACNRVRCGLQL